MGRWRFRALKQRSGVSYGAHLLALNSAQDASNALAELISPLLPSTAPLHSSAFHGGKRLCGQHWSRNGMGGTVAWIASDSQPRSVGDRRASESEHDSSPPAHPTDPHHKVRNRNEADAAARRLRARSAVCRQGRAMNRRKPCDSHPTPSCDSGKCLILCLNFNS
mgnify:CR=1 FL=1